MKHDLDVSAKKGTIAALIIGVGVVTILVKGGFYKDHTCIHPNYILGFTEGWVCSLMQ